MHHSSSEEGMGVVERGERERVIICGYECAVKRLATGIATAVYIIVGERERANLVVQLACFFYIYIYIFMYVYPGAAHTVMFYVLLNMR